MKRWFFAICSVLSLVVISLVESCSSEEYRYVPVGVSSVASGLGEAVYAIPTENPTGNVRVRSLGTVDLREKESRKRTPVLHVRMSISNQSRSDVWLLNIQEQTVSFPNGGRAHPMYANSDSDGMPSVNIDPGQMKVVDLYFPLPDKQKSADQLQAFDLAWDVKAAGERVSLTTAFDRVPQAHQSTGGVYPYASFGMGWGPMWWYGPGPWVPVGPPPPRPTSGVVIVH